MKIAFQLELSNCWYGGISHYRNLAYAINNFSKQKLEVVFIPHHSTPVLPEPLKQEAGEIIKLPSFERDSFKGILTRANRAYLKKDYMEEHFLAKHKVDIVLRMMFSYKYSKIPTLSFISDFQHVHFPNFNDKELAIIDKLIKETSALASRVITMSQDAKKDFLNFLPQYEKKVRLVKIVSHIPEEVYSADLNQVLQAYHLPEKFIYLPHQFWQQKNHQLVFNALHILKKQGVEPVLVLSGYPGDFRLLHYFGELVTSISKLGIRNQIIYLGMIPHEHVLLLMRQSLCVLSASVFEGWGLAVDEANSIGKSLIISDIPVHREHNCFRATFFNPKDSEELAEKLKTAWNEYKPGPDLALEAQAREELPKRLTACAESFMSIMNEFVK